MRKFYTNYVLPAAVFAVSLLSYGCVDREYSLDNIDGGGSISVGDVITTPPVTATSLSRVFWAVWTKWRGYWRRTACRSRT